MNRNMVSSISTAHSNWVSRLNIEADSWESNDADLYSLLSRALGLPAHALLEPVHPLTLGFLEPSQQLCHRPLHRLLDHPRCSLVHLPEVSSGPGPSQGLKRGDCRLATDRRRPQGDQEIASNFHLPRRLLLAR